MPRQRVKVTDNGPVTPEQRFTTKDPCPICGGHQDAPRKSGHRCWGFRTSDGRGVVCTQEESDREAGDSEGWYHKIDSADFSAQPKPESDQPSNGAVYAYTDERSKLLFSVVRGDGKRFHQEGPNGEKSVAGIRKVPFRLPQLIAGVKRGDVVYVAEGEKDVLAIEQAGAVATTNPGGAGKWHDGYAEYFKGARVRVVQDQDDKGRRHARDVRRSLLSIAGAVEIVEALDGKDAADHLDAGHSLEEFVSVPPRFELLDRPGDYEERPVCWLFEPVLVERGYTLITADTGIGKTWLALGMTAALLIDGKTVAYLDEENGQDVIIGWLRALGVDADTLNAHFRYFPYPSAGKDELDELVEEIKALDPALAVFDPKADFLTLADFDEDSGTDNTIWWERVVRPLQITGVTVCELDHSGHSAKNRPRGSSAKEAKAEYSWVMERDRDFDPKTTATVTLKRGKKNRRGALPKRIAIQMGGDGKEGFIFRLRGDQEVRDEKEQKEEKRGAERRAECRHVILMAIQKEPGILKAPLRRAARGYDTTMIDEEVAGLEQDGRIRIELGPRKAQAHFPIRKKRSSKKRAAPR